MYILILFTLLFKTIQELFFRCHWLAYSLPSSVIWKVIIYFLKHRSLDATNYAVRFTDNNLCTKFIVSCHQNFNFPFSKHFIFLFFASSSAKFAFSFFQLPMSKPNERSCRILGNSRSIFLPRPLLQWGSSKQYNFFSSGPLLSLEKYVRQKFSLCLFSKNKFEFVCFPSIYAILGKKDQLFWKKEVKRVGNRQTQIYFLKTDKVKYFI